MAHSIDIITDDVITGDVITGDVILTDLYYIISKEHLHFSILSNSQYFFSLF